MKKLMVMIAAVASTFGLYAAAQGGFDGVADADLGAKTQAEMNALTDGATWSTDQADASAIWEIKKYGSGEAITGVDGGSVTYRHRPSVYATTNQANYAWIKTSLTNETALSYATAQTIGDGIYVDTLVKFTMFDSDSEPTFPANAKIGVWLQTNAEETQTNLMITAGKITDNLGNATVTNYNCGVWSGGDGWNRLTIKAIGDISNGVLVPGFVVYIDGNAKAPSGDRGLGNLTLTENAQYWQNNLLPSARGKNGGQTFTGIAMMGQGGIDDISFTTTAPVFAANHELPKITVDGTEYETMEAAIAAIADITSEGNHTIALLKDVTIAAPIVIPAKPGSLGDQQSFTFELDLAGYDIVYAGEGFTVVNNSALTIKDSKAAGNPANAGSISNNFVAPGGYEDPFGVVMSIEGGALTIQNGQFNGLVYNADTTATQWITTGYFAKYQGEIYIEQTAIAAPGMTWGEVAETDYFTPVKATYTIEVTGGTASTNEYQISDAAQTVNLTWTPVTGKKCTGWTVTAPASGVTVSDNVMTIAANTAANIAVAAQTEAITYTATFTKGANITSFKYAIDAGAAQAYNDTITGLADGSVITLSDFVCTAGYEYKGTTSFTVNGANISETLADATVIAYEIAYNLDLAGATNATDAVTSYNVTTATFSLLPAGCVGYTFNGWTNALGNVVTEVAQGTTGNITVYASWTQAGPTPVEPGEPTVITTDDPEKAKAAVQVSRPSGVGDSIVTAEAYDAYFAKTAVNNHDGTFTVTATLDAGKVAVTNTAVEIAAAVSTNLTTLITTGAKVVAKPGLYYSLDGSNSGLTAASFEEGDRVLATGNDVTVKPTSSLTFTTKGFFKVLVNTAPKAE